MFPGCLQDFSRIFFQDAPMGLMGLVEFDDHFKWKYGRKWSKGIRWSPTIRWTQLFEDPQLFDDQLEVWTLTIQKSTVIPQSLMVLFLIILGIWRKKNNLDMIWFDPNDNKIVRLKYFLRLIQTPVSLVFNLKVVQFLCQKIVLKKRAQPALLASQE